MKYEVKDRGYDLFRTDEKYLSLVDQVLTDGEEIETRNSKVRRSICFQMPFTTTPLVRVRKTAWKSAIREWEWFMSGSSNINDLHPSVRSWWEPWASPAGNILFNYSKQLRRFRGEGGVTDQVQLMVDCLKKHPNSRRNILTTWNTEEMNQPECPITNCHNTVTQAFVVGGNKLRLVTYQRSVDVICGLPHNWIQMAAFQLWLCSQAKLLVDGLTWIGGDVHVYDTHLPLAKKMLEQTLPTDEGPVLCYEPTTDEFRADDFYLSEPYEPLLTDRAEMVV